MQLDVVHRIQLSAVVEASVAPPLPLAPPLAEDPPVPAVLVEGVPPVPPLEPESLLLPPHAIIENATITLISRALKLCIKSSDSHRCTPDPRLRQQAQVG